MSTGNKLKINQLLSSHVTGTILLSSWLSQNGYNLNLQKRYRKRMVGKHWFWSDNWFW